jgi:glutamate N-acetyltransferase/amino-acid N-acetyltransferase
MLLANGESGLALARDAQSDSSWAAFASAVKQVCVTLAKMIVLDGEGATKLAKIHVVDAASAVDARLAARAVANSLLVKTSWFGEDPNWGRVIDVVGYSGAELDASEIEIWYDDVCAYRGASGPVPDSVTALEAVIRQPEFTVKIRLGTGDAECSLLTCDISEEYVRINSEYTT